MLSTMFEKNNFENICKIHANMSTAFASKLLDLGHCFIDCVCAHECTHSSFVDLEGRAQNPWKRIHIRGRRWYHCLWTCVCVCVKIELERLTGQNLALAFESRLSFFLAENQIFIYLK